MAAINIVFTDVDEERVKTIFGSGKVSTKCREIILDYINNVTPDNTLPDLSIIKKMMNSDKRYIVEKWVGQAKSIIKDHGVG